MTMGRKIRQYIAQPRYHYKGQSLQLTVRIGRTSLRSDETLHNLLARADQARYRAKQSGRNRVCCDLSQPAHA